jgi:hypothetical protein
MMEETDHSEGIANCKNSSQEYKLSSHVNILDNN